MDAPEKKLMQDTNESLGSYLKRMREENNISIEQVAYATRISLKMLRALEEDDHTALPASTFVRGYLQAYAKYVRIDTQDLLLRYQHHLAMAPDVRKGAIKSHYLYVRERYQEKRRLVLVIVLFATMLSVAGTYFLLKAKRERGKRLAAQAEQIKKSEPAAVAAKAEGSAAAPAAAASPAPAEEVKAEATAAPKPEVKAEAPKAPDAPAPKPEPVKTETAAAKTESTTEAADTDKNAKKAFNLLLIAEEDVWLRFQTDQDEVRDLTLRAGKAMMLRADKVIKIFSGNLGALKATMNGTPVDSLTTENRSKSVVLPVSEAPNFPLPLFPQFQPKAVKDPASAGQSNPANAPQNPSGAASNSSR